MLTGLRPLSGGARGWPFGRTVRDLERYGYVEEEYLIEGEATRYVPESETALGRDGRWEVTAADTVSFRTRMLVMRPGDPALFNGTVVVSWNNVSAGYDIPFLIDSLEILEGGYGYAAVTAQRAGVHGRQPAPMGLVAWDRDRYGSLSIPSDDYSFDIFTHAVRALGPERPRTVVDPMGGLDVRRIVAHGSSQSASRLATYFNAVHPRASVVDGFLISLYFGSGALLEVGDAVFNSADLESWPFMDPHLLRDDTGTPIMVLNSETESDVCFTVSQPESDTFRYWEVAGAAHFDRHMAMQIAPMLARDLMPPPPPSPGTNAIPTSAVLDAALRHVNRWVEGGSPPPIQPRISRTGDPPVIERDTYGLACGGVRLPQVEVPVSRNSSEGLSEAVNVVGIPTRFLRGSDSSDDNRSRPLQLQGSWQPFPYDQILALYGDRGTYLARFEAATRASIQTGVVLERDVEYLLGLARDEWAIVCAAR
jgi:hypothetical protein